jgi:hypothetical protein
MTVNAFLLVLAIVFLALAMIKLPEPPRLSFGWAGVFILACLVFLVRGHLL